MKKTLLRLSGLVIAGLLVSLPADARVQHATNASVTFDAVGPAGMKIHGTTNELKAEEKDGKVEVRVPLAGLTTGIGLRDRHMREKYLETDKYPDALLTVPRASLKFPAKGATVSSKASGTLKIHGVSKPTTFEYSAAERNGALAVDGKTSVNIKDYNIDVPSYFGITVKPDVGLHVVFTVQDK